MRRTISAFSDVVMAGLPAREELLEVVALRLRERGEGDEPTYLRRVVVQYGRFQPLARGRRLPELAAEPAEQAHGLCVHAGTVVQGSAHGNAGALGRRLVVGRPGGGIAGPALALGGLLGHRVRVQT